MLSRRISSEGTLLIKFAQKIIAWIMIGFFFRIGWAICGKTLGGFL